jgi:DNA-binding beta-propeller fold protein YncE
LSIVHYSRLVGLAVAATFALADCGGSSSGTAQAALPPGAGPGHRFTHARLVIKVPPQKHRKNIRAHGHYISPASASLTYTATPVVSGATLSGEIDISAGNPHCAVTGVIGYLTCSLDIVLVPATPYVFSFTVWDGAGGSGDVLSANDNVPFTATPGGSDVVSATLGGVASSLIVSPVTPYRITGSGTGLEVYGNHTVKFAVTPVDAAGDFIIGPGAPLPSASLAPGANATFAAVGAASPNEWSLTSQYQPSDPGIPSTTMLNVSATPVPGSGGSTLSLSIPVNLYQPWVYVADFVGNSVTAYDEDGNVKIGLGSFSTVSDPTGIAYDPDNGRLYVAECPGMDTSNCDVAAFDRMGNLQLAAFSIPVQIPLPITYDSNNHWFYVLSNSLGGGTAAFDAQGNLQSIPGGFPGLDGGPRQIAFDPQTKQLYASHGLNGSGSFGAFDETGARVTTSGGFPNVPEAQYNACSGYDPIHAWIWTCDYTHLAAYDGDGNPEVAPTQLFNTFQAWNLAFDPYNGLIYLTDALGHVQVEDQRGDAAPPDSLGSFAQPVGIALVK